ncbi:MAG: hypothetical protein HZA78_02905 [Candidatus Schekmanbacteria bacterium]|nr:hypothetical protein [Candidatus Schekmanbacteria bacterium]
MQVLSLVAKKGGTGGSPVQQELFITRRNLPHWEMGGSTYFITYRCQAGIWLDEASRTLILENWQYWDGKRYLLHAAVVMPDHVHVLITPKQREKNNTGSQPAEQWWSLTEILHTSKSFTAHEINKIQGSRGSIWQDERFDRIVRDETEFLEKWNYMLNNPVKTDLVKQGEVYHWLYQNPQAWIEGNSENTGQRPVPPKTVL